MPKWSKEIKSDNLNNKYNVLNLYKRNILIKSVDYKINKANKLWGSKIVNFSNIAIAILNFSLFLPVKLLLLICFASFLDFSLKVSKVKSPILLLQNWFKMNNSIAYQKLYRTMYILASDYIYLYVFLTFDNH